MEKPIGYIELMGAVLHGCINRWKCLLIYIIVFFDFPGNHTATASSAFSFNGTSTITSYYSNRQAYGHAVPPEYLSLQLNSRLTIFHVPLNVSSVLSTQQHQMAQPINHVSVRLDVRELRRFIRNDGRYRFLKGVDTFELGRSRPVYSRLILHGVPVSGVNVSLRARSFHTSFVYGNSQQPVRKGVYLEQQYRQKMLFGRMGLGHQDKTFVAFSFLHAQDDPESIDPAGRYYVWPADTLIHHLDTLFIPSDSAMVSRQPGEVLIPGVELGTALFKRRFGFSAELAGMIHTANTSGDTIRIDELPDWVDRIHPVRISTSVSYAYHINAELRFPNTRLHASWRLIAPGFHSPGTPLMSQDQRYLLVRGSQSLFNKKLTIQPHYRIMNNNLLDQNRASTHTTIWGVTASWRITNMPWISVSFSPHRQEMADTDYPSLNKAKVVTVSTGKNYELWEQFQALTSVSWSHQQSSVKHAGSERLYRGNNISVQQSLTLQIPLRLITNAGVYLLESEKSTTSSFLMMLRGNYTISPRWSVSAGGRYFAQGTDRRRWSARLETSYSFRRHGSIQLLAEPIYYRDVLNPEREYDQFVVQLRFVNSW